VPPAGVCHDRNQARCQIGFYRFEHQIVNGEIGTVCRRINKITAL